LIQIKSRDRAPPLLSSPIWGEKRMPVDSMIVSAGVVAMFALFAVVMVWVDCRTRDLKG
jgi:hypothetical protein